MDPNVAAHLPALVWLIAAAALVFFMQAGFAAVEAGTVRYKNAVNVALKNVIDLCCSFSAFFVVGFSLMFGHSIQLGGWGIIGMPEFFLNNVPPVNPQGTDVYTIFPMAAFLFQVTFCNTAATIVSGGVAERSRFMAYVLVSFGIGIFIYPVFGHWAWGGGWLMQLGYHDFAGSSVVHLMGAGITLAGIQIMGNRIGKYGPNGEVRTIAASSMPLVAIGVCFLAFGWIGFNGGSKELGVDTAGIIVNTLNAGCFGGLAVMLLIWAMRGVPDAGLILNGVLGGLVAITANADVVSPPASAVIGLIGGAVVLVGTRLMDRWKWDDAVGAVPVHGFAGVAGVLCTGLFATPEWLASVKMDRGHFLGVQVLGALVCFAWAYGAGLLLWWLVGRFTSLRIGPDEEAVGMNYSEHQVEDPMLELTQALTANLQGQHRQISLDNVREGDLVPIVRALNTLVGRLHDVRMQTGKWASNLRDLRLGIQEQQSLSARGTASSISDLSDSRDSLLKISAFLDQIGNEHAFVPVLADLVRQVQRRIDLTLAELPTVASALERVKARVTQLDDLAASMRQPGGAR